MQKLPTPNKATCEHTHSTHVHTAAIQPVAHFLFCVSLLFPASIFIFHSTFWIIQVVFRVGIGLCFHGLTRDSGTKNGK